MASAGAGDSLSNQSELVNSGPYQLENNDHPGVTIVTAPFSGNNYLTWSISIQISLGAKDKLGFIDGSVEKPKEGTTEFLKWRKADYMVRSWILGSLTKELAGSFVYCTSAKILWEELKERFA